MIYVNDYKSGTEIREKYVMKRNRTLVKGDYRYTTTEVQIRDFVKSTHGLM